jgi:hypothetical protein
MQTRRYLYVNNEDLSKILYDDDTVLVLNAPINFTTLCYQFELQNSNNVNFLKVQSRSSPIVANVLSLLQEPENKVQKKRPNVVNIKSEFEEPERKKRHYDDDDGDLVTAEILFKKFSSDVAADAADHDEVPSEKELDRLIHLSPLRFNQDYSFGLMENEGISDLFDVKPISV